MGSESQFTAIQKECATPPHVHPMSRYVTARDQFYQAFPHVSTASDQLWGEKAWVRGYHNCWCTHDGEQAKPGNSGTKWVWHITCGLEVTGAAPSSSASASEAASTYTTNDDLRSVCLFVCLSEAASTCVHDCAQQMVTCGLFVFFYFC